MKPHRRARNQGVRTEGRESVRDQKPGQEENGTMARNKGRKWGVSEEESRGAGGAPDRRSRGLEAQLTDSAVGAGIARAGAVTPVAVKAEADTHSLVLAGIVTTGVHCG